MPWVKIDDQFADHPKFVTLDPAAIGLWVSGLAYCNRHLTDGKIPKGAALRLVALPPTRVRKLASLLVGAGIWEENGAGYHVHDYLAYQLSASDVRAERKAAKERKDRWKERRRNGVQNNDGTRSGTQVEHRSERVTGTSPERKRNDAHARASTRPDPTHPKNHVEPRNTCPPGRRTSGFEEFYAAYPRRVKPRAAERAWKAALTRGSAPEIMAGLKAQLGALSATERTFIPHPATWLNADGWKSEVEVDPDHNPYETWPELHDCGACARGCHETREQVDECRAEHGLEPLA